MELFERIRDVFGEGVWGGGEAVPHLERPLLSLHQIRGGQNGEVFRSCFEGEFDLLGDVSDARLLLLFKILDDGQSATVGKGL